MNRQQRSTKQRNRKRPRTNTVRRRGHARPTSAHSHRGNEFDSNCFDAPEVWHEPTGSGEIKYISAKPGSGYFHPITKAEAKERVSLLPEKYTRDLEVVQLSGMTKKRALFPLYGMQWGPAVYLYPIEDSMTEFYSRPPQPQLVIDTKMYGGQWSERNGSWVLTWTEKTIRDFYLNNILIHEIGHINDTRNRSYRDRERYANWFAIEYGFRQSRR